MHGAQGIMIHLHHLVIVDAVIGKQPFGFKNVWQNIPRSVHPFCVGRLGFVGAARTMHAQLFIGTRIAIQRFDHKGAPWPIHDFGGRAHKLFGDKAVTIFDDPVISEQPPRDRDGICIGQCRIKCG